METSANKSVHVGLALGVLTFAVYLIGSNRSFGYDEAATFANFVATPSIWDAFAVRSVIPTIPVLQVATNDHVLLSLVSHLIYSVSGSRSEVVYRVLPALAAAATVGISTSFLSRRFGLIAGVCAGIFIATDPIFSDNSRDLRGYSLATLASLAGTLLLPIHGEVRAKRGVGAIAYAAAMAVAIAAQLFAGAVLLCHVAYVLTRRPRTEFIALLPAWMVAGFIGIAAYVPIYYRELTEHGLPSPFFYPTFPRDLIFFLAGAPFLLPMALWVATAALGLWTVRRSAAVWTTIAVVGAVVVVFWLILQPAYFYPRFFVFLVPAIAYVMASAIQRWWVLAPLVLVGAGLVAYDELPTWTEDPLALPQAAAAVERIHATGGKACVIHSDEQILTAYTSEFIVVTRSDQLTECDAIIVVSWGVDLALRDQAAQEFPRLTTLKAFYPAVVLVR